MSSGYDQFFKKAQQKSPKNAPRAKAKTTAEDYLRQALKVKKREKSARMSKPPLMSVLLVVFGLGLAAIGYLFPERVEQLIDQVEITFMAGAQAASEEKTTQTSEVNAANSAGPAKVKPESGCTVVKGFTDEELSHFNKLNERKEELDRRDAELTLLEEELHKQKREIEDRLTKLEQIREEVASVLKERVEMDQQRVGTLVDFYSNMKPKQAAEIFGKLNEDLAVEVLGKMKKKNAADILNLLEPAKARALSEKFTGYKRR